MMYIPMNHVCVYVCVVEGGGRPCGSEGSFAVVVTTLCYFPMYPFMVKTIATPCYFVCALLLLHRLCPHCVHIKFLFIHKI